MRRVSTSIIIFVSVVISLSLVGFGAASGEKEVQREFVGVSKCKMCHKSAKQGEQFVIWSKGPHAKAYAALAGEEAKAIAKERKIEDPQTAPECLKCHVTAYGVDAKYLGAKHNAEDGVGCESCHGAGGDYNKKKTMVGILLGDIDPASVGLIKPDEKLCVGCHNEESPTFKKFDYKTMIAKIAHPVPEETKAAHKKPATE
jgi:hypothetical protein